MLREEWLHRATDLLRPYFKDRGYEIPEKLRLSCGWPSTGGLRAKAKRLGECWNTDASSDGVHQIFISPHVSDTMQTLEVLVHELLHACLPKEAKHKKPFKQGMKALDLIGSPTATQAGDTLKTWFKVWIDNNHGDDPKEPFLIDYPNSKLDKVEEEKEKKQTVRMRKIVCRANEEHSEDIILRGSKKVLDQGLPICWCKKDFEIDETGDKDEE